MSTEIKPCPFCGNSEIKTEKGICFCTECGAQAAKPVWNQQKEIPVTVRKLKRLLILKTHWNRISGMYGVESDGRKPMIDTLSEKSDAELDKLVDEIMLGMNSSYYNYYQENVPWDKLEK